MANHPYAYQPGQQAHAYSHPNAEPGLPPSLTPGGGGPLASIRRPYSQRTPPGSSSTSQTPIGIARSPTVPEFRSAGGGETDLFARSSYASHHRHSSSGGGGGAPPVPALPRGIGQETMPTRDSLTSGIIGMYSTSPTPNSPSFPSTSTTPTPHRGLPPNPHPLPSLPPGAAPSTYGLTRSQSHATISPSTSNSMQGWHGEGRPGLPQPPFSTSAVPVIHAQQQPTYAGDGRRPSAPTVSSGRQYSIAPSRTMDGIFSYAQHVFPDRTSSNHHSSTTSSYSQSTPFSTHSYSTAPTSSYSSSSNSHPPNEEYFSNGGAPTVSSPAAMSYSVVLPSSTHSSSDDHHHPSSSLYSRPSVTSMTGMERANAARNAVRDAAGGEWRDRWESSNQGFPSTSSNGPPPVPPLPSGYASSSTPQAEKDFMASLWEDEGILTPTPPPMILTTPPVHALPSHSIVPSQKRTTSLPQQQQPHPTFTRPLPNPRGTLSPNSSLLVGLRRSDSNGTTGDGGGSGREYLNPAFLSNLAVWVKDRVPRGVNMKGALEYPESFTGEQLVTTILNAFPPNRQDRRLALQVARSLQQSLWLHEVLWSDVPVKDTSDGSAVYMIDSDVSTNEDGYAEIPTGVLTGLTKCYSSYCGRLGEKGELMSCYCYTCPNAAKNQLQRQASLQSTQSTEPVEPPENWVSSVPQAVADKVDKKERQRQLVMFELIQLEEQYVRDLEIIETAFIEPLRNAVPPIIDPNRIEQFISSVLLNVIEIRSHASALSSRLKARQQEAYIVSGIGDLLVDAALDWGDAYVEFASRFPLADQLLKEEKGDNPRFNDFLMDFHNHSKETRIGFETFHKRPTIRLMRYILPLEAIVKNTPESSPDRAYVTQMMEVIKEQANACNEGSKNSEGLVQCRIYHRNLVKKVGDPLDLDLLNPERKHFMSGKVFRRTEGAGFNDWSEAHLILFDHYLVTTKPPRADKAGERASKYHISRRAIPLELLQLRQSSVSDPPVVRSSGFHLRSSNKSEAPPSTMNVQESSSLVYPMSLYKMGRNEGIISYFVESAAARTDWETKLKDAFELRKKAQEASRAIKLDVLSDTTFGSRSFDMLASYGGNAESQFGSPTCSAPLTSADGQALVVAGCAAGLFIGFRGDRMRQVVHLAGITQCAVLQEFGFVLVLAQGALIAYPLEALIPSGRGDQVSKTPQRLSGKTQVLFFQVGKVGENGDANPRTLVIYVKKSGMKESVFKALEPVSNAERAASGGGGGTRFRFGVSKGPEWFRTYKEFFLPSFVSSVQFLRSKLAIVGGRGVEIMNLETLRTMTVPDFSHVKRDIVLEALMRRCDEAKTLGMFRIQDNLFLLAYDEFAFLVDKHGEPMPGRLGLIEWESKPDQVAYEAPYIYAFSPNLVEVRHTLTGELCQVVPGSHISLTYDGSGLDASVPTSSGDSIRSPVSGRSMSSFGALGGGPERRIHFSMRVGGYHGLYEIVQVPYLNGSAVPI